MRVIAWIALAACSGGGGGKQMPPPDASSSPMVDALDEAADGFNAFVTHSTVFPGAFTEVQLFFQAPGTRTYDLSFVDADGLDIELDRSTLDAVNQRAYAIVEIPTTAPLQIRFTARATNGSEVHESEVVINLANVAEAEPGFEVYIAPETHTITGSTARFRTRVIPFGGFSGTVSLHVDPSDLVSDVRFTPHELTVSPGTIGNGSFEVDAMPSVSELSIAVRGASGRVVKVAEQMSPPVLVQGPSTAVAMKRRIYVAPGTSRPLPVVLATQTSSLTPTSVTLESPPAGITLASGNLGVASTVAPGVYPISVLAQAGTSQARRTLRVVVPASTFATGLAPHAVSAFHGNGLPLEVLGAMSRSRWNGTSWTTQAEDASTFRTLSRGTLRVEARRSPNSTVDIKEIDLDPNSFGTRIWTPGFTSVSPPSVAVDGSGQTWAAGVDTSVVVYRRGTVAGGVPILSGLPGGFLQPLIAASGSTIALATPTLSDTVDVRTYNAGTLAFVALPSPGAQLAALTQPALVVDASGRPVLAYIGTDDLIHVRRYDGTAWSEIAALAASAQTVALTVTLDLDDAGKLMVAAYEAAHAPAPPGWPAATARSGLHVWREGASGFTETVVGPYDAESAISGALFDLDASGAPIAVFAEDTATGVVRIP